MQSPKNKSTANDLALDCSAITASMFCALHCVALPLLIGVLPASLLWLDAEWVHRTFVLIALPISGYAIARSITTGNHRVYVTLAITGLVLLVAAAFVERLHDHEIAVTLAGAVILIVAHVSRWIDRTEQIRRQRQGV